jgi:hypothetical protein
MEPGKMVPSLTYTDVKWTSICHLKRTQKFHNIIEIMVRTGLLHSENTVETVRSHGDNRVRTLRKLTIHKILKYKDEWAKRSGVATELNGVDTDTDINTTPIPPPMAVALKEAVPQNGNGKKHRVHLTEGESPELAMKISEVAIRLVASHRVRPCTRDIAEVQLRGIVKLLPKGSDAIAELDAILQRHEKKLKSWDWTHDNRKWMKGLKAWLNPSEGLWKIDEDANLYESSSPINPALVG